MRHTANKWQIEGPDRKVKAAMLFGECEGFVLEARA